MKSFYLILGFLIGLIHGYMGPEETETLHKWQIPPIGYYETDDDSVTMKFFSAVPFDVQPHYGKNGLRIFFTTPKIKGELPSSLLEMIVDQNIWPMEYLLQYPSPAAHNPLHKNDCNVITSAVSLAVDECNRMWVIDSGFVGSEFRCAPQLLAFDLDTDELVYRHRFDESFPIHGYTPFVTIALAKNRLRPSQRRNSCDDLMVYVANGINYNLVVHDVMNNDTWSIHDKSFYPNSNMLLSVAGEEFYTDIGVIGLVTDNKHLYYHALSGVTEYRVPLDIINNRTLLEIHGSSMSKFVEKLGERESACVASAMDSDDNLYCVTLNPIQLLQWNIHTPYTSDYLKALPIAEKDLEFVSGMKVLKRDNGVKELWMVSNRFQKVITGTMNFSEENFQIVRYLLPNNQHYYGDDSYLATK